MATIKDVAKRANVSTTTVSHVINKTRFVAEETRNAVWAAIKELHYSPSAVARSLKVNHTKSIGLLATSSEAAYFAEIIEAVEKNCFQKGYTLILDVLIYAACSASFFAWLTGSPFILSAMGYSPAVIGLSYVPQTIAFLIGGYGCRAALQKWQGYQLLPWLLGLYALSVIATWGAGLLNNASLVEILIPFCVMAIANGAIYPIVVAQALRPFPQATGRAAALQNTLQLGLCFLASLVVSWLISTPLLTTTSVMLSTVVLAALGYKMQSHADCAETGFPHANVAHDKSH